MHTEKKTDENSAVAFVYNYFKLAGQKILTYLRVIAVHGTMTIKFYVEF